MKKLILLGLFFIPSLLKAAPIRTVDISTYNYTFIGYGRNRIINGAMRIDQRNSGATKLSSSTNNSYGVDRFYGNVSMGKLTLTQISSGLPSGFTHFSEVLVSSIALTVGAGTTTVFGQTIEGSMMSDFLWGTSRAKTVTLSFLIKSSSAGVFSGALTNSATDRSYPFSYTIPDAVSWNQIYVTVPGDTTGTWLTTAGIGARLRFDLGSGSTFRGTNNTWAASNFVGANGTSQIITVLGSSWNVTGVQLEISSAPTSYEYRPDPIELQLCQRSYEKSLGFRFSINGVTGNGYSLPIHFSVQKRTTPVITVNGGTSINVTAAGIEGVTTNGFTYTLGASGTGLVAVGNSDDATWIADADF